MMIRFVIGLFVFAVALCAYIVNLPREDRRLTTNNRPQLTEVSRAGSTENLALPAADTLASGAPVTLPFATTSDPLSVTIATILVGLGLPANSLGSSASRQSGAQSGLELMVLQALQSRMADAEIDARINSAATEGALLVPDVLVRADARVDSNTLLAAIITRAGLAAGTAPAPAPNLADFSTLIWVDGQAFHTVAPQDSLASLAARYLGDATRTDVLLVANANVLSRADRIATGQTLLIPGR